MAPRSIMAPRSMPLTTRRQLLAGAAGLALAQAAGPARAATGPAPRMHRGIGVHNLLNWPETTGQGASLRYKWPPFATRDYQMSPSEAAALKGVGFDFVRLTVDPSIFIVTGADKRPALEQHAIQTVRGLLDAGFSVVFDLHPVAVNPAYGPEALVDPGKPEVFNAYVDTVGRIATMLRGLPEDRVTLELFNEPWIGNLKNAPRWQSMLERLHAAARAADPVRSLVLNGLQWDSVAGLLALDTTPFRGSNVLYTFHYYEPHAFTHQGVQDDTKFLRGLRWPEDDANARSVLDQALQGIAADRSLDPAGKAKVEKETRDYINQLVQNRPTKAQIAADFASVSRWGRTNNVPPERILLGEFGCAADPSSDPANRLAWLKTVRMAADQAGFPWAYWAYKGKAGMTLVDETGGMDPDTLAALGLRSQG